MEEELNAILVPNTRAPLQVGRLAEWFYRWFVREKGCTLHMCLPVLRTALLALLEWKIENGSHEQLPAPLVDWLRCTLLPALLGQSSEAEQAVARLVAQIVK